MNIGKSYLKENIEKSKYWKKQFREVFDDPLTTNNAVIC